MIDFKNVEKASSASYVTPGIYKMRVKEAKFTEVPAGKSSYVELVFERVSDSATMKHKFYISEKEGTIKRLKYLHEDWTTKELTKGFNTIAEAGAYFEKLFQSEPCKKITQFVKVSGTEEGDGKVYANLSFADFIIPSSANPEETTFEKGDTNWMLNVVKNMNSKKVANTNATHVSSDSSTTSSDDSDGLPF